MEELGVKWIEELEEGSSGLKEVIESLELSLKLLENIANNP